MVTRDTWAARVGEWTCSGMTAAEYAERKGLKAGTLKWWSSQLNRTTPATSRPPVVEVTVAPTRAESSLEVVLVSGVRAGGEARARSRGYTGSSSEKYSFVVLPTPGDVDPEECVTRLLEREDPRVSEKWGPAGCLRVDAEEFLFFGCASC